MKTIKDAKTFDELLDIKYGKVLHQKEMNLITNQKLL